MNTSGFFSTRLATWLVLLIGIGVKSVLIFYYSFVGRDKLYHLSAADNLLNGKGWSNSFYTVGNINSEILEPFCHWPPGYGLLLTPLYAINSDIHFATVALELFFFVLLILICRSILKILGTHTNHINWFTLLICFFPYDFIEESLGTDLPAMVCLLAGIYFIIRIFQSNTSTRKQVFTGVFCGAFLFASGLIRYNYVLVAFALPFVLILACYLGRQRMFLPGLFSAAFTSVIGSIGLMLFMNASCGEPLVMVEAEKGFFPRNLTNSYPAIISSVTNTRLIATTSDRFGIADYSAALEILSYCNLFLYIICIFLLIRWLIKLPKKRWTPHEAFILAGSVASILIVGTLAYLSLTNALKPSINGNVWTYIVEGRYYAFVIVFFQLLIFSSFTRARSQVTKNILTVTIVLISVFSLHQLYFATKIAINYKKMKSEVTREMDYNWFTDEIDDFSESRAGVIVASTDMFYPLYASMQGHKGIIDPFSLNNKLPEVDGPTVLYLAAHDKELSSFEVFLKENPVTLYKKIGETNIYTLILPLTSSAQ